MSSSSPQQTLEEFLIDFSALHCLNSVIKWDNEFIRLLTEVYSPTPESLLNTIKAGGFSDCFNATHYSFGWGLTIEEFVNLLVLHQEYHRIVRNMDSEIEISKVPNHYVLDVSFSYRPLDISLVFKEKKHVSPVGPFPEGSKEERAFSQGFFGQELDFDFRGIFRLQKAYIQGFLDGKMFFSNNKTL